MKKIPRSPWLVVTIGILGLVAGYTLVIVQHDAVFAGGPRCPYHHTQSPA